jgi:hypothetical protein
MRIVMSQMLFKACLCVLISACCSSISSAQSQALPFIHPAEYKIKIETSFPYQWDPNKFIYRYGISKSFDVLKGGAFYNSEWSNKIGLDTAVFYISGTNLPDKLNINFRVDSLDGYDDVDWSNCINGGYDPYWTSDNCPRIFTQLYDASYTALGGQVNLTFPFTDTTIYGIYNSFAHITVNTGTDNNFTLPSHDTISIKADSYASNITWQYEVLDANGNGTWVDIPLYQTFSGTTEIRVNGLSLFGANWINQLNKTVLFRMVKSINGGGLQTSNILVYTHRLSTPRIINSIVTPNRCYGQDSALVSIRFNRPLINNESLNIFLKDSISGADYSALNLSAANFGANETYTWNKELTQGVYRLSLIGKYLGYACYTGSPEHFGKVVVIDPPKLQLSLRQIPALCYQGNSGTIVVRGKGGAGNYKYQITDSLFNNTWFPFISPTFISDGSQEYSASDLYAKSYKVKLRDGNDCRILDSLGNEVFKVQRISQPLQPLSVPNYTVSPVTVNNGSDGSILIGISGGTPFTIAEVPQNFKRYDFEWRDSSTNSLITNYTLDTIGKFETKIQNLPSGTYHFVAWDRNYNPSASINQQGCKIDMFIRIKNPNPLNVYIDPLSPITCMNASDGKIKAVASGGIPISDSSKYTFWWYVVTKSRFGSVYLLISTGTDSILSGRGPGNYVVDIRDKYNNVIRSATFYLDSPESLTAQVSSLPSSCYFSGDGSMGVTVNGGTPPYRYEWSTGALTQQVYNVAGGTYYVVIKDSNLCQTTSQVVVSSPNRIITTASIVPVTCYNVSSGTISLSATGGSGVFSYLWNNNATSNSISNLSAGKYWYRITDANGCYDTDTLTLNNPDNYSISAGPDRKICTNQMISLTPIISGGFSSQLSVRWITPTGTKDSSTIRTVIPGMYIVQATNSTGCVMSDTMLITTVSASVNTNFTVSTQAFAGENTTLVNISPVLQDSVKWMLPSNMSHQLISSSRSYCELKIADTGVFRVGMTAYYSNGCIDEIYKPVNVVRSMSPNNLGNQADAFLKQFTVLPNPTSGSFTLNLLFNAVTQARVRIVNVLTNVSIDTKLLNGSASYSEQYNISSQAAGTFIIIIETAKGNFIYKLNKI